MKTIKIARIIALALLCAAVFASIDLGFNFLKSTVDSLNDGIGCFSVFHIFGAFGDSGWSQEVYLRAFETSAWITFALFCANIFLAIFHIVKQK